MRTRRCSTPPAKLAALDVGSLPICGEDDRLKGMLTDRDIVVKALAQGKDPGSTTAASADEERVGDLVEAISAAR